MRPRWTGNGVSLETHEQRKESGGEPAPRTGQTRTRVYPAARCASEKKKKKRGPRHPPHPRSNVLVGKNVDVKRVGQRGGVGHGHPQILRDRAHRVPTRHASAPRVTAARAESHQCRRQLTIPRGAYHPPHPHPVTAQPLPPQPSQLTHSPSGDLPPLPHLPPLPLLPPHHHVPLRSCGT